MQLKCWNFLTVYYKFVGNNYNEIITFLGSYLTIAHIKDHVRDNKSSWMGLKKHKINNIEGKNVVEVLKLLKCVF